MTARVEGVSDQWMAAVVHAFKAHVRDETAILEAYEAAATEARDEGVRFLLGLILSDERRHHELFEAMVDAARGEVTSQRGTPPPPGPGSAALVELTERFLTLERQDGERLRELRRQLKPAREGTLWHLLVELMELDTAKHVRVLEYLVERLRRGR